MAMIKQSVGRVKDLLIIYEHILNLRVNAQNPLRVEGLKMKVLIVQSRKALGKLWQRHLERMNMSVCHVCTQDEAVDALSSTRFDIILLDLVLANGSALAVSDFASYRHPEARVIFVTNTTFFSDGSIFAHSHNACAFLPSATPPDDLAAMDEHYAAAAR
jgi:DNA-binding NtrC family response regulator